MMKPDDFPQLREDEFVAVYAEVETGIVLTTTGRRALASDGAAEKYRVFSSRADAADHAKEIVARHPRWECVILDWRGEVVETCRNVEGLREEPASPKRIGWWRRWFAKGGDKGRGIR